MPPRPYNIPDLIRRTGRRSANVILPPISATLQTERAYLKAERAMLRGIARAIAQDIVPRYRAMITRDADAQSFDRLKRIAEALVRVAQSTVNRILGLEAQRHTEKFVQVARTAIGIDVSAIVTQEDLTEYMALAARRNADLIKSQSDDMIRRIELATIQNQIAGNPVSVLRKKLTEEFGIADRRAKLIARDQTAKLNSDLNRIRQEQAAVERYQWMTSHDERVRELHRRIDGNEYQWGKPTGAESGLPPGQPIQCRCVARGIVRFGVEEKPKPVPSVAVETVATRNTRLDAEAKTYVVNAGKKDGKEHLVAIDTKTGKELVRVDSPLKSQVSWGKELTELGKNPENDIVIHHNHPSHGLSFSDSDLDFERSPGMKGIWAHAHNGTSYYAERGEKVLSVDQYRRHYKKLISSVKTELTTRYATSGGANNSKEQVAEREAINLIFHHQLVKMLEAKKYLKYQFNLVGVHNDAWKLMGEFMNKAAQNAK